MNLLTYRSGGSKGLRLLRSLIFKFSLELFKVLYTNDVGVKRSFFDFEMSKCTKISCNVAFHAY